MGEGAGWIVPLAELATCVGQPSATGRRERQLVQAAQLGFGVGAGTFAVGGGQGDAAVAEGEVEEVAMAACQLDRKSVV